MVNQRGSPDGCDPLIDPLAFAGLSGNGSLATPYLICNYSGLSLIRNDLTAYYRLTENIDARDSWSEGSAGCAPYDGITVPATNACAGWVPVGDSSTNFTGNLNGNSFSVSDLYVNVSGGGILYGGLFGVMGSASEVSHLGLRSININVTSNNGDAYGGGFAGEATSATIQNCYAEGVVTVMSIMVTGPSALYGGGLVGISGNVDINSSYANALVIVTSNGTGNANHRVGGLTGNQVGGQINHSYAAGDVESVALNHSHAGAW